MILVLSDLWLPFPGGAERMIFNLSRHLLRRGHDVRAFTGYEYPQQFDGPPVTIGDFPVFEHRRRGERAVTRLLRDHRPALILTQHLYAYEFEKVLVGRPVVQVVLNTRRLAGAARAVYITEWVRATLGDSRPGDIVVYPPALADVIAADRTGGTVGFIKPYPHKGAALVWAIAESMPHRRFLVLRGEWQTLEDVAGAPANVEFVEPVDDIRDFWRRVDLVLMPSESEDAGTVPQEAALNLVPCISSAVGGLPETNGGGLILDSRDPAVWAGAIDGLLDDRARRALLVDRQFAYIAGMQSGQLDMFATMVEALL